MDIIEFLLLFGGGDEIDKTPGLSTDFDHYTDEENYYATAHYTD